MDYHFAKPLAALCVAALAPVAARAQARDSVLELELNPYHSRIEFSVPFMGLTSVKGAFEDFGGLLVYRVGEPARSSVTLVIRAASLHTGNATRDRHLASDDFFDVERYPTIVFQTDRIERRRAGRYAAIGSLTMHGVTRQVVLPVRMRHRLVSSPDGVDYLGFDTALRLNWRSFGISGGNTRNPWFKPAQMLVNDSVDVTISMEAVRRVPSRMHYPGLDSAMSVVAAEGSSGLERRYRALQKAHPDSVERFATPLADAGRALIERGRNRDGISVLELNLEAHPRDADALAAVARGHLALGDTAAAVGLYRRALAADDAHAAALEMLRRLGAGGAQGGTP